MEGIWELDWHLIRTKRAEIISGPERPTVNSQMAQKFKFCCQTSHALFNPWMADTHFGSPTPHAHFSSQTPYIILAPLYRFYSLNAPCSF